MTQPPPPDPSPPEPYGQPTSIDGAAPAHAQPLQPYGAPVAPQAPGPAQPASPPPAPYGQHPPQAPAPYGQHPPQAPAPYGQYPPQAPAPYGQYPPQAPAPYGQYPPFVTQQPQVRPYIAEPPEPLGTARPATPRHDAFAGLPDGKRGSEPPQDGDGRRSAWNAPAFGLLAIALVALVVIAWPQVRARKVEASVKPLVVAFSHRDAHARCPRYITSVLTDVGSVRLDGDGNIADRTDLTGPVCAGLRHLYAPGGKEELRCLTAGGVCPESALVSVVAISVVAHESMHLRGQLDEGRAECESIGESAALSASLGIPLDQARMVSYLHYAAMNPYTPERYQVSASNCTPVAELEADPPGDPAVREALRVKVSNTWRELAT